MTSELSKRYFLARAHLTVDQNLLIAKYIARADYVRGLRSTSIVGLAPAASEGYFVMLKLALAYSGLELAAAITSRKNSMGIQHSAFAQSLRRGDFDSLLRALDKGISARFRGLEASHMVRFKTASDSQDLTKLVSALRNYMLHGSFTPNESGLAASKKRRELILALANTTLLASDEAITTFLIKAGRKRHV
jgi:hypothetical protein